jgi:hypothetical protein
MQATKYVTREGTLQAVRLFAVASKAKPFTRDRWTTPAGAIYERRAAGLKAELAGFEDPACPHVKAGRWTFKTALEKPAYNPHVWDDADFKQVEGEIDPRRPIKHRRVRFPIEGPRFSTIHEDTVPGIRRFISLWFKFNGVEEDGDEEHRLITISQRIHSLAPLGRAEIAAPRDWLAYAEQQADEPAEWTAYNALGEEVGFQIEPA